MPHVSPLCETWVSAGSRPNGAIALIYVGAVILAGMVVSLGVGLLRAPAAS